MPFTSGDNGSSASVAVQDLEQRPSEAVHDLPSQVEILRHLPDEQWILDADLKLLFVNRPDRERLLGTSALELLEPAHRAEFERVFDEVRRTGVAQTCETAASDGTYEASRMVLLTGARGAVRSTQAESAAGRGAC
jgi:hypothetical protein